MADPCSPNEGMVVGPTCGVFVDPNAPSGGDGSKMKPFDTLAEAAMDIPASASAIYVCGKNTFTASITLRAGVSIYGGFNCASWSYSASNPHAELLGTADVPALTIVTAGTETFDSFDIQAADAIQPGGSSIAILVNGGELDLRRVQIVAGAAQTGAAGIDASQTAPPQAQKGNTGGQANSA